MVDDLVGDGFVEAEGLGGAELLAHRRLDLLDPDRWEGREVRRPERVAERGFEGEGAAGSSGR
jgi:hypothetical protein